MNAWARLGLNAAEAEKENEERERAEQTKAAAQGAGDSRGKGWWAEVSQLWAREVRLRTFLGCFFMAMQQVR